MFYTEIDPFTGKSVFVPKEYNDKKAQRALLQYGKPENRDIVLRALKSVGREDLVGFDKKCLIRPAVNRAPTSKSGKGKKATNGAPKSMGKGTKNARAKKRPKLPS